MNRISRRIATIAESATLAIDARAKAMAAAGRDVVIFGAGEPDFATPPHIVEAAQRAAAEPRFHRYTPTAGLPALREAVAEKTRRDSGVSVAAASVLVTNGGKHAVYNAFATLLDPGDEVLLPTPYWVTYPEAIALAGGVTVEVPTDERNGFRVTIGQLEAALSSRSKVLLFVSPSNPTGAVYPPAEVEAIGRWAVRRGLFVVTDEIYEHLVYGGHRFSSLAGLLGDRVVIVNGVAKTFAMTGWRVGWMVGPEDIVKAATSLQSHATSNVSNVAQMAALAALTGPMDSVAEMRAAFDRRRRVMHERLSAMKGVVCHEPEGAFYAFPSLRGAIEGGGYSSSFELSEALLERAGVAIVPGEAFGAPGYARLSYALGDDDLARGLDRMGEFLGR